MGIGKAIPATGSGIGPIATKTRRWAVARKAVDKQGVRLLLATELLRRWFDDCTHAA